MFYLHVLPSLIYLHVSTFMFYFHLLKLFGLIYNSTIYLHLLKRIKSSIQLDTIYPETTVDVKVIKRKLKCVMFDIQSMGENEEWTANNFLLNNIPGLRSSARLNT